MYIIHTEQYKKYVTFEEVIGINIVICIRIFISTLYDTIHQIFVIMRNRSDYALVLFKICMNKLQHKPLATRFSLDIAM